MPLSGHVRVAAHAERRDAVARDGEARVNVAIASKLP
jgi:hypothetical protein